MVLHQTRIMGTGGLRMHMELTFTPIDQNQWERGQTFYYFSKMAPTGYSLTVDIDVTNMLQHLKAANLKFFPAYLWLATKCLNEQQEFRIVQKDDIPGYYSFLTPLYATFHEDSKTFSMMWTTYDDDFMTFYESYLQNQKCFGSNVVSYPNVHSSHRKMHTQYPAFHGFPSIILPSIPMAVLPTIFLLLKPGNFSYRENVPGYPFP